MEDEDQDEEEERQAMQEMAQDEAGLDAMSGFSEDDEETETDFSQLLAGARQMDDEEHGRQAEVRLQPNDPTQPGLGHSAQLRNASRCLALAEKALVPLVDETSTWILDRLTTARRLLDNDLELASAATVEQRLKVLLKQYEKALQDTEELHKSCDDEKPEVMELRRAVTEYQRRLVVSSHVERLPNLFEQSEQQSIDSQHGSSEVPAQTGSLDGAQDPAVDAIPSSPQDRSVPEAPAANPGSKARTKFASDRSLTTRLAIREAAFTQATQFRIKNCEASRKQLLAEAYQMEAGLEESTKQMRDAVNAGQALEDEQEEAAQEVGRAFKALTLLSGPSEETSDQTSLSEKVKQQDAFVASMPAAPWRIIPLARPTTPGGSTMLGGGLAAGSALDPEVYRASREKARTNADKALQALKESVAEQLEDLRSSLQNEEECQDQEKKSLNSEVQKFREQLAKRRQSIDVALVQQEKERERRVAENQQRLQAEIRHLEANEHSNHDALRREVQEAKQRLAQTAAAARTQLENRLANVRIECRQKLYSTGVRCEQAVLAEREAMQEAKQRRVKWQRRAQINKDAFKGHCVKTGVYARTMDAARRRQLDMLVPRSKVGDVYQ
eukprot:TRINITY_DN19245_c0_g1_i1.p1 TRINITY_DN19245_c0_g1~~TRINITY_DN19245_c0_g1_i1.p1  ORF type:complete len:631 (-),score=156.48 TRINITY_DN19245_c0_g1_i1:32-1873(-)